MNELMNDLKIDAVSFGKCLLVVALVVIVSRILMAIIGNRTNKLVEKYRGTNDEKSKQIITTLSVGQSVSKVLIYGFAFFFLLNYLGFGSFASEIIVTAGIGGLIISLGAQSLIKDLIAGLFIILEHQFEVGDYIKIGDQEGDVRKITIRCTYLDFRGKKIIIPNGSIDRVINFNSEYNAFRFAVPTSYSANTAEIIGKLNLILQEYYHEHQNIFLEKPQVLGVSEFGPSSVDILVQGKCKTLQHFVAERELKLLIKTRFDEWNIEIPYNQLDVNIKK